MSIPYYDIIIIGSGMSGLYTAYNIQNKSPQSSFLILEKYKKQWIGGRTNNEKFYGVDVVTGAGIGRKDTNPLLIKLLHQLNISFSEFKSKIDYAKTMKPVNIIKIINKLKIEYKKHPEWSKDSFKVFFIKTLGDKLYKEFIVSAGYTDYEYADVKETLYNYGMDDNMGGWIGLHIPWKKLVEKLYHDIGSKHFQFSSEVVSIKKMKEKPCLFEIEIVNGLKYYCNKVIVATTISGIQKIVPGASSKNSIYQQIHGQPFLRLYAKFDKKSAEIMKEMVPNYTIVPGPLQKILPMNGEKGIYMISYSDNNNALILKKYLENTSKNREIFCHLTEQSLGIPIGSLKIIAIKDFYWPIGTHYYDPLQNNFKNRDEFVYSAQHPEKGMLVVGEAVSRYQGWVEGALESVKTVLSKKWIQTDC